MFAPFTYELVIELINDSIKPPFDKLILYTIASIFEDFLIKTLTILLFISTNLLIQDKMLGNENLIRGLAILKNENSIDLK